MKNIVKGLLSFLMLLSVGVALTACGSKDNDKEETNDKTVVPSVDPTKEPSLEPSKEPSKEPTVEPTEEPTIAPTPEVKPIEELVLKDKLVDGGDGVYTMEMKEEVLNVHAVKAQGKEWASAKAVVQGDLSKIKSLRFTISGSCVVLMKIESKAGAKEINLQLTATKTAYEWDLSGEAEQKILAGEEFKVLLFALPGSAKGEADVMFDDLAISKEEAMFNPIESGYTNIKTDVNNYDGVSATFDINHNWAEHDADTYKFEQVDNGVKVTFTKTGGWNFAKSPIAGSFGKFPYLVMKLTGTKGQAVMFKAEAGMNVEKTILFNGEAQIAVLDLSKFDEVKRNTLDGILFFAAPNDGTAKGEFIIHDCYFSMTAPEIPVDPVAPKVSEYDGKANSFDANRNWFSKDLGVYEVVGEKGPFTIKYDRQPGQSWSSLAENIKGNFGNFNTLHIGLKLPEGMMAIVKVQNDDGSIAAEAKPVGTGDVLGVKVDMSGLEVAGRNQLSQILIFVDYENKMDRKNQFEIHWCGFEDFVDQAGPRPETSEYDGKANSFDANRNWYSGDKGVYEVVGEQGPFTIKYDRKPDQSWSALKESIKGNFGNFKTLHIGMNLPEGMMVIVKVAGKDVAAEAKAVGTGVVAGIKVDLSKLTVEERNTLNEILIFVDYENKMEPKNQFEIHWCGFEDFTDQEGPRPEISEYDGKANNFDANRNWYSGDKGVYEVVGEQGPWTIKYDRKPDQSWSALKENIKGNFGNFKTLHIGMNLPEGMMVIVKVAGPNGAAEAKAVGTGQTAGIKVDMSNLTLEQRNSLNEILIFVDYENKMEPKGQFEIHWCGFEDYADQSVVVSEYDGKANSFDANRNWYSGDKGVYEVVGEQGPWTIKYDRKADQNWSALKESIKGNFGNFNTLHIGMKLPKDMMVIVKIAGPKGAAEAKAVGTGDVAGIKVDMSKLTVEERNSLNEILIFVDYENKMEPKGQFEIHWCGFEDFVDQSAKKLEYNGTDATFDMNHYFKSLDEGVYTPLEEANKVTVNYNRPSDKEWTPMVTNLSGDLTSLKKLNYKVSLGDAEKLLIKLEGTKGNIEVFVTADNSEGSIDLSDKVTELGGITKLCIFVNPGIAGEFSGSFVVLKVELAK